MGALSSTYTFVANTSENGYEYEAVFSNASGSVTTDAAILTVQNLMVTEQPTSQIVAMNATATFTATASGVPTPTEEWEVSTDGGETFVPIAGANTSSYQVTATTMNSGYEYEARFSNSFGQTTTNSAVLAVSAANVHSTNWSGYAATGATFTSVSGSWTVPDVTCANPSDGSTSEWIGIDGDGNQTVEQDGTEADCAGGSPQYYAWYEMYGDSDPNLSYGDAIPLSHPVYSGDVMYSAISVSGTPKSDQTWSFEMQDLTSAHFWTWTTTVTLNYSHNWYQNGQYPQLSSAEWIVERPETCITQNNCSLTTLARFDTVSFTDATATATSGEQPISSYTNSAIEMMVSSTDSTILDVPGPLDDTGENFLVTWTSS